MNPALSRRPTLQARLACSAAFLAATCCALWIFQIAAGAYSNGASDPLFTRCAVIGGALAGYWHGPLVISSEKTRSLLEALWRSELILAEVILIAIVLRQIWLGTQQLFGSDPLDGIFKLMMVAPYAPIIALMAFLYTFWASVPAAVICGSLLFYSSNPEARRQRLNRKAGHTGRRG